MLIWSMFVHASLYKRREENQIDATEWFIALIIFSTCFGHLYAHHQEIEIILVCWRFADRASQYIYLTI